jgi:ATP-dependent protease HslVU (ClpYQ) peptidase subunit
MTVLAGISDDTGHYIAADTRATEGPTRIKNRRKIAHASHIGVATTGDGRAYNVVHEVIEEANQAYIRAGEPALIRTLRKAIQEDGCRHKSDKGFYEWGGAMLIITPAGLYSADSAFSYCQAMPDEPYALGSGAGVALGAMAAPTKLPAQERLWFAISIAARYDSGCGGEVDILHFVKGASPPTMQRLPLKAL